MMLDRATREQLNLFSNLSDAFFLEQDEEPLQQFLQRTRLPRNTRNEQALAEARDGLEPGQQVAWAASDTIKIYHENRHRKTLSNEELESERRDMLRNRTAILIYTETNLLKEHQPFINMAHHHVFHAEYDSTENLIDAAVRKAEKQSYKTLANPGSSPQARQEAEDNIKARTEEYKAAPQKHAKHGISVFVNQTVFPMARQLSASKNHIMLELKDGGGQTMILGAIYGPPGSTKENNDFFARLEKELLPLNNLPMLLIGDFNAVLDRSLRSSNKPLKKKGLPTMMHALALSDLLQRNSQGQKYTFQATKRGASYKARLDNILANQPWVAAHNNRQMYTDILAKPAGRDHNPIQITMALQTNTHISNPQKRYRRVLTSKDIKALKEIKTAPRLSKAQELQEFMEQVTTFQEANLSTKQGNTKKPLPKNILKTRTKLRLISKTKSLLERLHPSINYAGVLALHSMPHAHDTRVAAQLTRKVAKLKQMRPELYEELRNTPNRPAAIVLLQEAEDRLLKKYNGKLSTLKKEKIAQAITRRNDNYETDPRAFWKSINSNTGQGATPFITTLNITDPITNQTHATAQPEEIKAGVQAFYEQVQATKGDRRQEFEAWMEINAPISPPPTAAAAQETAAPFSKKEIEIALKELANNKGTGPDQIPAELLKMLWEHHQTFPAILEAALNEIYDFANILPSWKLSESILLYKNKGSRQDIANYRPISLVQVIYKLYSTIVTKRLSKLVEGMRILSKAQQGFRNGRGAAQKLIAIYAALHDCKRKRIPLHILSIDMERAFPSTEHWLIDAVLDHYKIPDKLKAAVKNTYRDCATTFKLPCGRTEQIPIANGVKQGDPLLAILFNLAINPLLIALEIKKDGFQVEPTLAGPHAYADDLDILATTRPYMEEAVETIQAYTQTTGLKVNVTKTKYIQNQHAKDEQPNMEITLDGHNVQKLGPDEPFTILGVQFTTTLNWRIQANAAADKLETMIRALQPKALTPEQMVHIINTKIIPAATYSAMVANLRGTFETRDVEGCITRALKSKASMHGPYLDAWLNLPQDKGGLGLNSVLTIIDAQKINAWYMVLNGPECPAARFLHELHSREGTGGPEIAFPYPTAWTAYMKALERSGMHINSSREPTDNPQRRLKKLMSTDRFNQILHDHQIGTEPQQLFTLGLALSALQANDNTKLAALAGEETPLSPATAEEITRLWQGAAQRRRNYNPNAQVVTLNRRQMEEINFQPTEEDAEQTMHMAATDGSTKVINGKPRAAWSFTILARQRGLVGHEERRQDALTISGFTDYRQENNRAELTAIARMTEHCIQDDAQPATPFLVAVDSSYVLQTIRKFPTLTPSKQLKTRNRDLLRIIHERLNMQRQTGRIQLYLQKVPSHTDDPKVRERKASAIMAAQNELGDLYDTAIALNRIVDAAASKQADKSPKPIRRRGASDRKDALTADKHPSPYFDLFYTTQSIPARDIELADGPQFHHAKLYALENFLFLQESGKSKKAAMLRLIDDTVDCKRSFLIQKQAAWYHKIQRVLRGVRFHALPTMKKMYGIQFTTGIERRYRLYYKATYPTPNCPYCEGQEEDTMHFMTCPNRASRTEAATATWNSIYAKIRKKQSNRNRNALLLKPFAHNTQAQLQAFEEHWSMYFSLGQKPPPALLKVKEFSEAAGRYCFIPKALKDALVELSVPYKDAKKLATKIALKLQQSIAEEYYIRCKHIAAANNQKQNYRTHILRIANH